ncbi:CapA family protein [bacterium LRH843]|nr:CapA family protein [bacterium LRH843]
MSKKMTLPEKVLKTIKKHKRKVNKHTFIATILTLLLLIVIPLFESKKHADTYSNDTAIFTASMVGDMMFGRHVEEVTKQYGTDSLFRHVEPFFKESDYITGNFEHPVVLGDYEGLDKFIHLKTDAESVHTLERMNFTNVSLANNHTLDYGPQGLEDTIRTFEKSSVDFVGAGRNLEDAKYISYEEVNGVTIATLGFSDSYVKGFRALDDRGGILVADPNLYMPLVHEANQQADLVIVHLHAGQEYDGAPSPRQVDMNKAIADAGADIIIGHHPHVLMPVDVYNDTLIMYSLGNFIFDQGWSRTRDSVLAQYQLEADGTGKLILNPMRIREGQPRPLTGVFSAHHEAKIFRQLTKGTSSEKWYKEEGKLIFAVDHSHVLEGTSSVDQ